MAGTGPQAAKYSAIKLAEARAWLVGNIAIAGGMKTATAGARIAIETTMTTTATKPMPESTESAGRLPGTFSFPAICYLIAAIPISTGSPINPVIEIHVTSLLSAAYRPPKTFHSKQVFESSGCTPNRQPGPGSWRQSYETYLV